jgi:hypothetical protein
MTKKLLTLFTLLTLSIGVGWAGDVTFTAGTDTSDGLSITKEGVTITITGGTLNENVYKCYSGQTLTVSSQSTITKIEFTCTAQNTSKYGPGCFSKTNTQPGEYTYSGYIGTWVGSANSISLVASLNQVRASSIVVTIGGSDPEPDPTTPEGTITFTPAAGEVTSGTTIAMSFSGTCDGIKYTLNGTSPSADNGTVYNASNPPAITAETTITAAAYNFSNNQYAFGTEATAAYTVVIPTVDYDGSVTFDATIDKPSSDNPKSIIKTPVTFTCNDGTLDNGEKYHLFKNSVTTFSVPNGYKIVKIEFTGLNGNPVSGFGTTTGLTTSGNDGVWIGEAQEVSFTASVKQVRCTHIKVYYTEPVITPSPYYLVGSFNSWKQVDEDYRFDEIDGTYRLKDVEIPANTQFKIIKVENGQTSASAWYGVKDGDEYNIHHGHCTGIDVKVGGNDNNFILQSAGTTSFSFQVGEIPYNLTVTRDPSLSIMGTFNGWAEEPMTETSDGWTTSQIIYADQEFRFVDEFGQWQGWNDGTYNVGSDLLGSEITIKPGDYVYKMGVSGEYTLNVNEGVTTFVINIGESYALVTGTDDLNTIDKYIIVSKDYSKAMAAQKSNNRDATDINMKDDGAIAVANANTQVLRLERGDNGWYFHTVNTLTEEGGDGYLYAASNSANHLKTEAEKDANALAVISFSTTGEASIVFQGSNGHNVMQYNSGSTLFACYESASQSPVYIYRKAASTSGSAAPTITPGGGNVVGLKQQVKITQANGGAIYYTTNGSTPVPGSEGTTQYSNEFWIESAQFGQEITVTAIAIEGENTASYPVSATYKFIAPQKLTLADIEDGGVVGNTYTVNDNLQVVYVATEKNTGIEYAFARDMGTNSSIAAVVDDLPAASATGEETDPIDFMKYGKVKEGEDPYGENPQVDPWQQNNWVRLDISGVPEFFDEFSQVIDQNNPVHIIIKAGRLFGQYTDNENYTIKVTGIANPDPENDPTFVNPSGNYVPNVYCPANFHSSSIQQVGSKYYWFMPPKPMEVFELTWALWYNGKAPDNVTYPAGFYMQTGTAAEPGPVGGVGANMSYNNSENVDVVSGASYRFLSVAMTGPAPQPTQPEGVTLRDWETTPDPTTMYPQAGSTRNSDYHIAAVNLDTKNHDQVITGVSEVKTGGEVVSVTYCDLAGRMSQKPFAGVNIIVTRYSDGTVKTTKAIK